MHGCTTVLHDLILARIHLLCVQAVVLPLVDLEHHGFITRPDLTQLHIMAALFAKKQTLAPPESLLELLDALYIGFDRTMLASQLSLQDSAKDALATIILALKVWELVD